MKAMQLNNIPLNVINLNIVGETTKKISRYVPDDEIPDTHTEFYVDTEAFYASDGGFYVKN